MLQHTNKDLTEILVWLYLTCCQQITLNPYNAKVHFAYRAIPAWERDSLYNLTLALKLPVQSLALIESLVASELADFTIHERKLSRELDPRLPNQSHQIDLISHLKDLSKDINATLEHRLRPLYSQAEGNEESEQSRAVVDDKLLEAQKAINLATSLLARGRSSNEPCRLKLQNLYNKKERMNNATRNITIVIPGRITPGDD